MDLRIVGLLLVATLSLSLAQDNATAGIAVAGTTNAAAGTTNAAAGTTNAAAGSPNAAAGSSNAAGGTINAAAGNTNTAAGTINAAAGTTNAVAGNTNAASNNGETANAASGTTSTPSGTSSGLFGSIFRGAIDAARRVMNADFGLKSSALNFSMDATNQVAGGLIRAKQVLENTKASVASSAVQFGTQAAVAKADMMAGLVSPIPVVGSIADTASRVFTAGANSVNAGVQTGISGLIGAKNAKLDAIRYGVEYGTGMVKSAGNAAIDTKKSVINRGFDLAGSATDAVDSLMQRGHNAFSSGLETVNGLLNSVRTSANTIAADAKGRIQAANPVNA